MTGGEASDSRNFELLLDIRPDILPRAAITDKGYDAKSNRDGARKRGICPVIPHRATATDRPAFFPKILYKARARIEQAVRKLKRFKQILAKYSTYYNEIRVHISLGKDAPCTRPIERLGDIVAHPILGGLHHRYARI
ncbi:MAG: transposase [Rhodoplanes sp.]